MKLGFHGATSMTLDLQIANNYGMKMAFEFIGFGSASVRTQRGTMESALKNLIPSF